MKIINTKLFYFGFSDSTAYHGKIKLSKREFNKAIKHILGNRQVSKTFQGSRKYPYLSKYLLKEDLQKIVPTKNGNQYALRVSATNYIVNLFKNKSRYHYKKQNYVIEVK